MSGLIYALIAAGMCHRTGKFWKSMFWPMSVGILIGDALAHRDLASALREAMR